MKNYVKYTKFFKEVALSKKWEKQGLKHIHFQQCLFMEQMKLFRLGPSKRGWPLWEFPSLGPFSLLSFLDLSSLTLSSSKSLRPMISFPSFEILLLSEGEQFVLWCFVDICLICVSFPLASHPLQCSWAYLVAQPVKNLPAMKCGRPRFNPWVGKIPWRREQLLTPVFFPGEFHGQRSLAGYSPWGHRKSDITERPTTLSLLGKLLHFSGSASLSAWQGFWISLLLRHLLFQHFAVPFGVDSFRSYI